MSDEIITCPYCKCQVSSRRLQLHTSNKCPKSPLVRESKLKAIEKALAIAKPMKKTILVRSRLDRLFRELLLDTAQPDDEELARMFRAFYTMYVWQGNGKVDAPRSSAIDDNGERSFSIQSVSGGLPSLGRRAK